MDEDFPVVSRHMAQQGIEVLGWDDWAQADVFVVFRLEEGQSFKTISAGTQPWQGAGC